MAGHRSFLFLQGNASWFLRRLGGALAERGHRVTRINVCGGDRAFWGDWQAFDWSGGLDGFDTFIDSQYQRHGVEAILLFGDCRPIHRIAIERARARGLEILVFEEGYLRPHWITLERYGVNGYSRLPDDPDWFRATAASLEADHSVGTVGAGLRPRILYDFWWQASNYLQARRFPGYRTHRPYPIWAEYASWCTRLATLPWRQAEARRRAEHLIASGRRFFLFPLQLDSDYQVRVHSPFGRMPPAIDAVIDDFAAHAPPDAVLLIKNHPLDNGWISYRRSVRQRAELHRIGERVLFIDGGDLNRLIDHAEGTVSVNSTVGLTALTRGRPVMCLGPAIYDLPGLTCQGRLAEFWYRPTAPDAGLLRDFHAVVRAACLVNGNFYTDDGVALAVAGSIQRLESGSDLLADAPPRRPPANRL
jgi:capsular polysaccharide export protein